MVSPSQPFFDVATQKMATYETVENKSWSPPVFVLIRRVSYEKLQRLLNVINTSKF